MAALSQDELVHFKTKLRERGQALRGEIRSTLERSANETHVQIAKEVRDREDESFSTLIVDLNFAEIERDADELRRVESALRRANEGGYGLCIDCDAVIPKARLEAEPTALRCVRCQERYEHLHATGNTPSL